jgi:hypothetical protein
VLLEAGLMVKMTTVNAAYWRNGLWRKRLWFVGLRMDIAEATGFTSMEPPVEPIVCRVGEYKSASDLIRYSVRDHSVDQWYYLDSLPHPWQIKWGKLFDTQEKRDAVESPDKSRTIPPLWMGYLDDGSGRTMTGFKVGCAKWGAYPITSSSVAEGLGCNQAFYHAIEPKTLREYITTIPVSGHQKAFGLEEFDFKTNDGFFKLRCMGQMGSPEVAGTMATWLELILNKYHRMTRTPPPLPRLPPSVYANWTVRDIMTPAFFNRFGKWRNRLQKQGRLFAEGKVDRVNVAPFLSKPEEQKEQSRGFIWDVTGAVARRVFRQRGDHRPTPETQRQLRIDAKYPDIAVVDLIGTSSLATGKNPKRLVEVPSNHSSWFDAKYFAQKEIREDQR